MRRAAETELAARGYSAYNNAVHDRRQVAIMSRPTHKIILRNFGRVGSNDAVNPCPLP